jgi:DnaJ-class molecular chaperone
MKDLYKTLGVAEDADDTTIKKSYRKLAKEFHPDATGGDKKKTERFKEVSEAYGVLGDKQKRAEYDRLKHAPVRPDGMPEGFDPESFAKTFGGGFGGGARGARGGVQFSGDFVDLGDIFSSLFGEQARTRGGRPGGADPLSQARVRPSRGSDMLGSLEVTFAEAALGTRRTVQTGSGTEVEVSIPPGVESGGRLRVPSQGAPSPQKNGGAGDLYLDINVTPDRYLRRNGHDVELELPVTVSEATLGAKMEVPTVEGRVTLTIPAGTSSGSRLRLRGRGVKKSDGTRGDQFCRVEIVVPKLRAEDTEIRKLFEDIARQTAGTPVRTF